MNNQTSISTEQLINILEQRLPTTKADEVAALLRAGDPEVQALFGWLQQFREIGCEPQPIRARTQWRREFTDYARARTRPFMVAIFHATLAYDSYAQPVPAGVQADTPAINRQLVYHSEVGKVTIDLQAQDGTCALIGQLFVSEIDTPACTVRLLQDQTEVGRAVTNELGEFRFHRVPAGTASLTLSSDYFELTIDPLPLHA